MKKIYYPIIMIVFVLPVSCVEHNDPPLESEEEQYQMILGTQQSNVSLELWGAGKINVDWGDKTEIEAYFLYSGKNQITHSYTLNAYYPITITGNSITTLNCINQSVFKLDVSRNPVLTSLYAGINKLTSLDVSHNTGLKNLDCYMNKLKDLDVSKNTELESLNCYSNQLTKLDVRNNKRLYWVYCAGNPLTSGALNELFGTLHNFDIIGRTKKIDVFNCQGSNDCDITIAENKGWLVVYLEPNMP